MMKSNRWLTGLVVGGILLGLCPAAAAAGDGGSLAYRADADAPYSYSKDAEKKDGSAMPFATDKTDRTLIKEIIVNQKEELEMLREIRSLLIEHRDQ